FFAPAPLNNFLENALHPRSISFNGYSLVPQGFLGLPLIYGFFGKIFSAGALIFFTPLLAILGALAFYGIMKNIFGKKNALFSFIIFLSFPPLWYYASRYLYSNVPFVSLLLMSLWLGQYGLTKKGRIRYLLFFAVAFGLALVIRPVEAVWVLPLFFLILYFYRKDISFIKVLYTFILIGFLSLPFLAQNGALYGDFFGSGYTLEKNILNDGSIVSSPNVFKKIFIFGFDLRAVMKNAINILFKYLWWYSLPALLGFFIWLIGKKDANQKKYFLIFTIFSLWLLIFYGSGKFLDNPAGRITLGDSHFRYWLPIFIAGMPFIYIFWSAVLKRFKKTLPLILFFVIGLSFYNVYFEVDDGLVAVLKNLDKNYEIKMQVEKIVLPEDIIITGRQDKIFFPERSVLYTENIRDGRLLQKISALNTEKFYYYTIGINNEELTALNNYLEIYGFRLERIQIFGKEVLYKLIKINKYIV
ncbi:glycosyltransferase family 39 protein, partial [Candidatus Parcubacteria bacterium]|nr:glycosyltransferase family 39 protein [Candidatus Parcubacteria bacterium]